MRPEGGAGSRATCSCVLLPDWRNDALAPRADTTPACVCTELPPETRVLPGHMQETTIGHERAHNPFVRV